MDSSLYPRRGPHILPVLQPGKLKTQVRSLGPPSYAKRAKGSGSPTARLPATLGLPRVRTIVSLLT